MEPHMAPLTAAFVEAASQGIGHSKRIPFQRCENCIRK